MLTCRPRLFMSSSFSAMNCLPAALTDYVLEWPAVWMYFWQLELCVILRMLCMNVVICGFSWWEGEKEWQWSWKGACRQWISWLPQAVSSIFFSVFFFPTFEHVVDLWLVVCCVITQTCDTVFVHHLYAYEQLNNFWITQEKSGWISMKCEKLGNSHKYRQQCIEPCWYILEMVFLMKKPALKYKLLTVIDKYVI